ncbi:MAG: hypothetical protein KAU38_05915 [Desulfobacterales bacterium]|nr:hypothetical protein [Desulfobacterales bacterium]
MSRADPNCPSGAGVGANGKNGGIFSTGEVFFLLTSPLMGDPNGFSERGKKILLSREMLFHLFHWYDKNKRLWDALDYG